MAGYRLRFDSYDLPRTLKPAGKETVIADGATPRVRAAGSVTRAGRITGTSLPVMGDFVAESLDDFLAQQDAITAALGTGKHDLWYGRDDRYYKNAQLSNVGESYPNDGTLYGVYGTWSLTFAATDYPEAFGTTAHAPTLANTGGTFTAQGDAETVAFPVWTITINSGGTGTLTLTNTTTGEVCTIKRPGANFVSGDVIVLTRDGYTATRNGVAVIGLFDRRIPTVAGGVSNTITLASSGTTTITSLACSYLPRFR